MTASAVSVAGLAKRYRERDVVRHVLRDVSFEAAAGEVVALIGPNGAGKTTTVEILEGYRRADEGVVRVLGVDPASGGPALRARVGLMLQEGGLDPRTRPRELIRLYATLHDGARDADELIERVGLRDAVETPVRRLSGGERRRLALALALVGRPEVVVLDEPTAGMDPEARAVTRALIGELAADGVAVLLTTHDLGDVERLAGRVLVLHGGTIVADGTPAALAAGARPRTTIRFASPVAAADLGELRPPALLVADPSDPSRLVVEGAQPGPALIEEIATRAAARDLLIMELRAGGSSLEERYLELTGDAAVGRLDPR